MTKSISEMFIKEALRTESNNFPAIYERITDERIIRLLHASMGLVTEAAELMDALKKFIFYGKELDLVNIKEEIGDSQWYTAIALDELGNSYEEIWAVVIKKLQHRYDRGSFNKEGAINRDLNSERSVIEHAMVEGVVDRVKMEIVDEPIKQVTHKSVRWVGELMSTLCGLETEAINTASNWEYVDCPNCLDMK